MRRNTLFRLNSFQHRFLRDAGETEALGAELARELKAGEILLLYGPLGVGKTTLVRGLLRALGHVEPVRSPTFNLLQTFETDPPVVHADLYRLDSAEGLGLEDYFETHLCLVEWPDRLQTLIQGRECFVLDLRFGEGGGRIAGLIGPTLI